MSVNKVILIGNVGTDPEIRYVETRPIASFRMATNERERTLADGSKIPERTEWHSIIMWDGAAEFAEKYIRKGSRLYVDGYAIESQDLNPFGRADCRFITIVCCCTQP